jgi:Sec-independent protein translocase protein TatA
MVASVMNGWDIVLIIGVVLIIFGARKQGGLPTELDEEASDAGRSIGGIYGKPAVEALTPDNQTAELYDPAAFRNETPNEAATKRGRFRSFLKFLVSRLLIYLVKRSDKVK